MKKHLHLLASLIMSLFLAACRGSSDSNQATVEEKISNEIGNDVSDEVIVY